MDVTISIPKRNMQQEGLEQAMAAAQRGDAAAYRALLETVRGLLAVYLGRVVNRMGIRESYVVEDLTQEVLLAVHLKRHTYDPRQPFLPWLFSIARYKVIDHGRRRRRSPTAWPAEKALEALADPVLGEPGAASDLRSLLDRLPERSRRALELVKLEGLSVAEAAARSQMSESALKVTAHRALKTLRELWRRKG